MDFGSKYVFAQPLSDEEFVSADEGAHESDDEQPKPKPIKVERPLIPAEDVIPEIQGQDEPELDPLTPTDAVLTVKNLFNSTKEVTDWFTMGLQLDIEHSTLQRIAADKDSLDSRKQEMLHIWTQSDPDISWEKLSGALQNMGHRRLSIEIKKRQTILESRGINNTFLAVEGGAMPKGFSNVPKQPKIVRFVAPDGPGPVTPPARPHQKAYDVDTNILALKFNILTESIPVHTGDPVVCVNPKCTAILNYLSRVEDVPGRDSKLWLCEFCGTENEVDIVPEEVPVENTILYIVQPSSAMCSGANSSIAAGSLVVFCMDVSGSMCTTTEVPRRLVLKGHDRLEKLRQRYSDGENQYLPSQRRNATYISRLQSVQGAVDHQLATLARDNPAQRVALITFNSEVTVIGDCRSEEIVVAGDKLWKEDTLQRIAGEISLPAKIMHTKEDLSKKLWSLSENGQTALGPALLLSVLLAGKIPGSKVIVCTDGLANRGLGSFDDLKTDEALASASDFYERLGTIAKSKSVTVSVCTIKGTDCRLLELSKVSLLTGGQVSRVDPLTVAEDFGSILANPVIATAVHNRIIVHSELYIRTDISEESVLNVPVGSVTESQELTYEFGVRKSFNEFVNTPNTDVSTEDSGASSSKRSRNHSLIINERLQLPFQLQIRYTDVDGAKCMRVITQAKPYTADRKTVEQGADPKVVGCHFTRQAAELTMNRRFGESDWYCATAANRLRACFRRSSFNSRTYKSGIRLSEPRSVVRQNCDNLKEIGRMNAMCKSPKSSRAEWRNPLLREKTAGISTEAKTGSTASLSNGSRVHAVPDDIAERLFAFRQTPGAVLDETKDDSKFSENQDGSSLDDGLQPDRNEDVKQNLLADNLQSDENQDGKQNSKAESADEESSCNQ